MVPDGTGVSLLETTLAPADSEAAASNPTLVPRSIAVHSMERYPGVQFRETRNQPLTPSGCASETACSTPSMVQPSPCSGFLPAGKKPEQGDGCTIDGVEHAVSDAQPDGVSGWFLVSLN